MTRPSHRLTALLTVACLAGLPATGEAKKNKRPPDAPKPTEEVAREGKISVARDVHGTTQAQLTDGKGKRWLLRGPLRKELRRLNGHQVKVWGLIGEKVSMATIDVRRYEMLDAGGRKPVVGRLRYGPQRALQLVQADQAVLTVKAGRGLTRRLRRRLGCKVWVAGEVEGETIKAFKFGWLRCGKRKPIRTKKDPQKKDTRR